MIAVDTSALMAVVLHEPERDRVLSTLAASSSAVVSAATLVELHIVCMRKGGLKLVAEVDGLIQALGIAIVPVTAEQAGLAHDAFIRFGKGNGHPAQLNFGDLFSYALAKAQGIPLLYKGADFAATDIDPALPMSA